MGAGTYGAWTRVPGSDADTSGFTFTDLDNGTTYGFKVRGVIEYPSDLGGTLASAASDEASATPNSLLVFNKRNLSVPENGSATYTVKLGKAPTANVNVSVNSVGDADVTVDTDTTASGNQNTLTFTTSNWSTAQTVTVAAAEDADEEHSRAAIEHSIVTTDAVYAAFKQPPDVTATEVDNDISVQLSAASLALNEGASATYTVRLSTQPNTEVAVTITRNSNGDADLTVDTDIGTAGNQNAVTFTAANWFSPQTITVAAAEDSDKTDDAATFTHTLTGGAYANVAAPTLSVIANDNEPILSVSNVATTTATLTIARHTGNWHHKEFSPGTGTCSSAISGATASLTGLTGNISYTYKAYSDSGCATELATATAFLTKPAQPDKPVAAS